MRIDERHTFAHSVGLHVKYCAAHTTYAMAWHEKSIDV